MEPVVVLIVVVIYVAPHATDFLPNVVVLVTVGTDPVKGQFSKITSKFNNTYLLFTLVRNLDRIDGRICLGGTDHESITLLTTKERENVRILVTTQ